MSKINEAAIKDFFEKMEEDKEFTQKICRAIEPNEVQSMAKEAGIELTMDDIMVAKDIIYKSIDRHNEGELSEDELDNVVGGGLIKDLSIGIEDPGKYIVESFQEFGQGLEQIGQGIVDFFSAW